MGTLLKLKRPRPLGVYVIVFLLAFRILDFSFATVRAQRAGLPSLLLPGDANPDYTTAVSIAGVLLLVALIIGLLLLKRWALVITTLLVGLSLAFGLLQYAQGSPQYLNMFGGVLVAFYLNQREVLEAFEVVG